MLIADGLNNQMNISTGIRSTETKIEIILTVKP